MSFRINADATLWSYAAASGGIADTTAVELVAAATGKRNYVDHIDLINTDATVGTEVTILSATTVIWRSFIPASIALVTQPMPVSITFPVPLQSAVSEALNVKCVTTSSQTYINAQGHTSA